MKSSAGWCLSFLNTATVPGIPFLEQMYCCDCTREPVALGAVSTEHSVMCSNYAVDGDEITLLRRLLTEIYPDTSFSAMLDSYDYWNVIDNVLPQLREEIMAHNGCMLMRGDSGDCVEVVTKTVFRLWDIFGGTVNDKGYKVLDPHVKAIYGDSITIHRCEEIYKILIQNGFACSNVALGVGSFSMQCIEEEDLLKPFTRDTFSRARRECAAFTAMSAGRWLSRTVTQARISSGERTCWKPCIGTACFCGSSRLPRSETGSITGVLEAEVPAEELDIFNRHIIGYIQVESEFSA